MNAVVKGVLHVLIRNFLAGLIEGSKAEFSNFLSGGTLKPNPFKTFRCIQNDFGSIIRFDTVELAVLFLQSL